MTAELAIEAVKNACLNVRNTKGIILLSNLGSQYTSQSFEKFLNSRGIRHSFSRKGNPYDNACLESFHSVLKKEEIYLHTYQNPTAARRAIFECIEGWYNRKRIHGTIGYMTPQQKKDEVHNETCSRPPTDLRGNFAILQSYDSRSQRRPGVLSCAGVRGKYGTIMDRNGFILAGLLIAVELLTN